MNYLYMLGELPTPLIILIVSISVWRKPPKFGDNTGYRTKSSAKSEEEWNAAQITYGRYGTIAFAIALAATLAADIAMIFIKPNEDARFIAFLIIVSIQCVVLIPVIAMTERKLNILFDENGKPRE